MFWKATHRASRWDDSSSKSGTRNETELRPDDDGSKQHAAWARVPDLGSELVLLRATERERHERFLAQEQLCASAAQRSAQALELRRAPVRLRASRILKERLLLFGDGKMTPTESVRLFPLPYHRTLSPHFHETNSVAKRAMVRANGRVSSQDRAGTGPIRAQTRFSGIYTAREV